MEMAACREQKAIEHLEDGPCKYMYMYIQWMNVHCVRTGIKRIQSHTLATKPASMHA
jgi:hypothetical protein